MQKDRLTATPQARRARTADKRTPDTGIGERFIADRKGRRTGVLLSMKRYRELLENLHDLAIVAERRNEERISIGELRRRLKEDAVI